MRYQRFLNPTVDFVFKRIFGSETTKEIFISFVNAALKLEGGESVVEVTFVESSQVPKVEGLKETVLDVMARSRDGREFIIEMQVRYYHHFTKRSLFYAARSYSGQLKKGDTYHRLKKVYFIGILDFNCLETEDYLSSHLILDRKTLKNELKDFEFCFIELPKFDKELSSSLSVIDKWIYFIKHAASLEEVPEELSEEPFSEAFRIALNSGWSRDELEYYEKREMYIDSVRDDLLASKEEGEKIGEIRGEKKGEKRIAKTMYEEGFEIGVIAKCLRLSIEEINEILSEDDP